MTAVSEHVTLFIPCLVDSFFPEVGEAAIRIFQRLEISLPYPLEHICCGFGGITNCLTFISGPNKTADMEAVMVHGAHGPKKLHLFVIAGEMPFPKKTGLKNPRTEEKTSI